METLNSAHWFIFFASILGFGWFGFLANNCLHSYTTDKKDYGLPLMFFIASIILAITTLLSLLAVLVQVLGYK